MRIDGIPVGQRLGQYYLKEFVDSASADGSIMIIVATDAPLSNRNLTRLARRALTGLARTGTAMSNGSGDDVIAFSTAQSVRRQRTSANHLLTTSEVPNEQILPLFQAVIEATEEAIYNSLCMATTTTGFQGRTSEALPVDAILASR